MKNKQNDNKNIYTDGGEEDLLKIFNEENPQAIIDKILHKNPSWPLRYHLSDIRKNLLSWYEFDEDKSLLEVGAGCGAITGLFCEKLEEVVAIEIDKKRAEIINLRHKNKNNLEVITDNIDNFNGDQKFDYVTSIGVLEYSGRFIKSENPYLDFLKKLKSLLAEKGQLILAIENKFGLKYWSGIKEDHTGRLFDSIEDYPEDKGIKTFSKSELINIIKSAGFSEINFYYPMPDYKMPTEIFSDDYLPSEKHNLRADIFPFVDYSQERKYLFDEKLALNNIINSGYFDIFANSFLIFAE